MSGARLDEAADPRCGIGRFRRVSRRASSASACAPVRQTAHRQPQSAFDGRWRRASRWRRSRSNRRVLSPPRLRHRVCRGAAHHRRTLASQQRMRLRFRPRSPACGRAARRRRALHRPAPRPRALPLVPVTMIAAMKMARMQPASTAADIVPQITFDPWTASPMRVLGVSAVADGDERLDASPDIGAAAPERPGLVKPCTADDQGDRHTAPIVIAGLCTSSRLPSGHQRRIVAVACPPSAKADPRPSRMPPSPSAAPVRVSPRAPPLPKMTMTMTVATAHRRVRQLPPCRTSPPGDELRDPCAGSPSVPPPMATSATTPRPTLVPPRLNGPASPSPALVTIMVIGQLRLP